jgi:serine/threonine-protein kinase
VHRDLKPENVMVGSFGQVYLMDWGGATLVSKTRSKAPGPPPIEVSHNQVPALSNRESFIGSAAYMAPEQAHRKNEDLDERTDIFQLGGILYEILTGRAPYSHCATFFEAILYASQREIASPEEAAGRPVPAELARIAMKAMAADPAERYPSAAALRKDVECFQRGAWHVPQQTFEAGARIVVEGEPGDTAYVIVEGRCLAYKGSGASRIPLREMGPGEVFGETAVLSEKPRTATVEALDPLTLLVVSRATLTEGLGLNSWLGVFVRALAERFRELDARLHSFEGHAP